MHRFKIIKEIADLEFFNGKRYIEKEKKDEFRKLLLIDIQNTIQQKKIIDIPRYLTVEDEKYLDNENDIQNKPIINNGKFDIHDSHLMQYYQKVIQKTYKIKYPDRSTIMSELLNIIPDIQKLYKYTIYKFDFEKFFYNISLNKFSSEIENSTLLRPSEISFLKNYILSYKKYENPPNLTLPRYCLRPGVGLNNALIEMLGKKFDFLLRSEFADKGLIYYARYVDDGILIFQENLEEKDIKPIVQRVMKSCFGDQIRLNERKSLLIPECKDNFDYLGYQFDLSNSSFMFGIAELKLDKYVKQIENIINEYKTIKRLDLLLLKLDIFYKRVVFYSSGKTSYYTRWKVRGISDSYREIKRFMSKKEVQKVITKRTLDLFGSEITSIFTRKNMTLPHELKVQIEGGKFINNFKENKAVILDKHIGYSYDTLRKKVEILCKNNKLIDLDNQYEKKNIDYYFSLIDKEIVSRKYESLKYERRRTKNIDELSYQELSRQLLSEIYGPKKN